MAETIPPWCPDAIYKCHFIYDLILYIPRIVVDPGQRYIVFHAVDAPPKPFWRCITHIHILIIAQVEFVDVYFVEITDEVLGTHSIEELPFDFGLRHLDNSENPHL